MKSNRSRVVEVPELLSSVAWQLNRRDRLQLLLVSRHFFRSVGPTVWDSVPRLDSLLQLIKGVKVFGSKFRDPQNAHYAPTEIKISLPPELDLTRFDFYAPWVHHLELFGGAYNQAFFNTRPLLDRRRERPLLPNLRRLTAYTGADISSSKLLWLIGMFICPSLTEIRTIIHEKGLESFVEPAAVPAFLRLVLSTCPQIQALEFYPEDMQKRYSSNEPDSAKYQIPGNEYFNTLASFSNLRSFASTMYILQPETFSVLGNLPQLESLTIRGSKDDDSFLDSRFSIPETWFPKLKELCLHGLHPRDIVTLWNQPQMSRKLVSAHVYCDPTAASDSSNDWLLEGNNWINLFLLSLPRLSPNIKALKLKVEDEDDTIFQLTPDARAAMRGLGLVDFELDNPGEDEDEDEEE